MSDRMKQLETLLADDPKNPFLHFAIAKEYEGKGKKQQALQTFLQLQKTHPEYVGLYYHLGKLQESLDDYPAAILAYEAGMKVAKAQGDKHAHGELSTAHWEISDED